MATTNKRFVAKNGLDNNGNTITNVGASGNSLGISGTGDLTIAISGTATLTVPAGSDTLVTLTGIQSLSNKTISGSNNTLSNIGNSSLTNSSVSYNGVSVALGASGTLYTDDISEDGSPVNLWFTNTRARNAVSATDAGGDGSFTYDSGTGVFTYTGPSATEVRAHLSAGTGLTYSSGQFAIDSTVATLTGTQTLTNKTISGADNTLSNIGNSSLTNSSITINGTSVSLGGTRTLVTDDIAEDGSPSNLWYTDTRSRTAISVTDSGGDGSLSYNSGSGVITYTGPSASEVRAHFSAGTGVTLSSGQISIGQSVGTGDNVTFAGVTADNIRVGVTAAGEIDTSAGNLTLDSTGGTTVMDDDVNVTGNLLVDGNLTVSGTTVTINTTNLAVEDNMIYLNNGSTVSNPDLGFAGNYNDGTYRHAGIFRDASDGVWKFYHQYTPEPDASPYIDITHGSFALAAIQAASFTGSVTGNVTGNASTATAWQTARTLTLSGDVTGTSAAFDGSGNISITTTIAANSVALGTDTTGDYVATVAVAGTGLSVAGSGENATYTITSNATSANTGSTIVARDASGNFTAGTITATLSGNATTATTLQTARNINGVSFNGSADITVTAAAGTLSGNTLASGVTASSLTSVGTLTSLTVSGDLTVDTSTLKVDSANNRVGVGTASPASGTVLDVTGLIRSSGTGFNSASSPTVFLRNTTATTGRVFALNSADSGFFQIFDETAGSATRLQIDGSGNLAVDTNTLYVDATNNRVGIGTASPSTPLHVVGIARTGGVQVNTSALVGGLFSVADWLGSGSSLDMAISAYAPSGGGNITFYTNGTSTERMRLDASGNLAVDTNTLYVNATNNRVGMGTTGPDYTLDVNGTFAFRSTGYAYNSILYAYNSSTGKYLGFTTDANGGNLSMSDNTALQIQTNGGNVGIGTTSPDAVLEINIPSVTTGSTSVLRLSRNKAAGYGSTDFKQYYISSSDYGLRIGNVGSDYINLNSFNGAVGIGLTSPSYKLHVRNDIVAVDTTTVTNTTGFYAKWSGGDTGIRMSYYPNDALCYIDSTYPRATGQVYGDIYIRQNVGGTLTTRMVFRNDSGNIGIGGETSPVFPLSVAGTIQSIGAGTDTVAGGPASIYLGNGSAGTMLRHTASRHFAIDTYSTAGAWGERLRILRDGNVGVGTTSPGVTLDVNGTVRSRIGAFQLNDGSSTGGGLYFYKTITGAGTDLSPSFFAETGYSLYFMTNGSVTTRMIINTSGDIGIGTTSPQAKLDVRGGILRTNTRVTNDQNYPVGHYTPGDVVFEIDPTWTQAELQEFFGTSGVTWVADSTAPGGYAIDVGNSVYVGGNYNSGFPYIPVDQDDTFYMECWIRNTSGSNAHYMGSIDYNESFSSLGGNPGSFGYWVMANTNPGSSWTKVSGYIRGFGGSTGQFVSGTKYWTPQALFNYSGGGTCRISGWKAIKVSQPGEKIFKAAVGVNMTARPSYALHVTGDIYATGNVTAYSDARAKENIITIEDALNKVINLRGVYYNKINESEKNIGVIAQEVLKVVPELVSYAKDIDEYSVKYQNITALLIEAIKELKKQLDEVKSQKH